MIRRIARALARPIVYAHRRKVNRQAGFALVLVTSTVAILAAGVSEFGYNARVEMESAANARDQLRAEYLARSGINLARLLIKVQQAVLDPLDRQFKMDIQIADFAPILMKAFGGEDGADMLAGFLGIGGSNIKGLGVGKGQGFDVVMTAEDGKININCGGGLNMGGAAIPIGPGQPPKPPPNNVPGQPTLNGNPKNSLYALLTALMFPPRYNRFFENQDADGQYATRELVARAIIDWSDIDESRYDETGASGNPEDYRYDGLKDPYKAHNNFYDTTDEVQLVQGVGDDFWGAFGEMFTVYGRCKVNLNAVRPENWPISAAILRVAAKDRTNPVLLDDVQVAALAQQISSLGQMLGGLQDPGMFADIANQKLNLGGGAMGQNSMIQDAVKTVLQGTMGTQPIELDKNVLQMVATTGPRQVYRIDSTGTLRRAGDKKIEVHIRAVFDTMHLNQNTVSPDPNDRMGTWVYWRME